MNIINKASVFLALFTVFCTSYGNSYVQDTPQISEATGESTFLIPIIYGRHDMSDKSMTTQPIIREELDPKVIKAWQKAGALVGWLAHGEYGEWQYLQGKPKNVASLPVFLLEEFEPGMIAKLPAPSVPFAIGLSGSGITDTGLTELSGLQNLQALDLSHTEVTNSGLKELAALKHLRSLDLGATTVTDAGLKKLIAFKSLQNLYFGSTAVSDAGLKRLARIQDLRTLYLYNTKITDTGIKELTALKYLQALHLAKTKVTDKGVAELFRALPNLRIIR